MPCKHAVKNWVSQSPRWQTEQNFSPPSDCSKAGFVFMVTFGLKALLQQRQQLSFYCCF